MGFFYWKAQGSDEGYIKQIDNINRLGLPENLVREIDLLWAVCLRLTSYNPVEADKVLETCSAKQIYEAYVMYHYDNFSDG